MRDERRRQRREQPFARRQRSDRRRSLRRQEPSHEALPRSWPRPRRSDPEAFLAADRRRPPGRRGQDREEESRKEARVEVRRGGQGGQVIWVKKSIPSASVSASTGP